MQELFKPGVVISRKALSAKLQVTDRTARNMIRDARKQGIPIVPVPGGGYKIAESDSEKRELLELYRGRALDELHTYSMLYKAIQIEGQTSLEG